MSRFSSLLSTFALAGSALSWAACGGGGSGPALATTTLTSTGPSTVGPSTVVGPVVYFAVDGGFANLRRSVAVAADGSLAIERGGVTSSGQLDPSDLSRIVTELGRSELFDRDREYPAPGTGTDLQRYEIRYRGVTVVAFDTTVPGSLQPAVNLLDQAASGR